MLDADPGGGTSARGAGHTVVWKGDELFWIRNRSGYAVLTASEPAPAATRDEQFEALRETFIA